MEIARRKVTELGQKLDSLRREFAHWQVQSKALEPLEKHHTQIRRITLQLEEFRKEISESLPGPEGDSEPVLARCRDIERQILEVHRIWEFFRVKLIPRQVDWFKTFLAAADEFAWACYQPARDRVPESHVPQEAIKEPPLVFFNGSSSPFAMPRDLAFQAEVVPGEAMRTEEFTQALKSLPIPVVGVPWSQIQHLPDALILGHEVGHAVEDDFNLTDRLRQILDTAMANAEIPADRQCAWHAWTGEVFADVYGTLAGGPAFAGAELADFLAMDGAMIAQDRRTAAFWGRYPTDYLRVLLVLEVLAHQNFQSQSDSLRSAWIGAYPSHSMAEFVKDTRVVARALLEGPYPELSRKPEADGTTEAGGTTEAADEPETDGVSLFSVLSFPVQDHERAVSDADRILRERDPEGESMRALFSAARLAFESDPEAYGEMRAGTRVLNRVLKLRTEGIRARGRREDEDSAAKRDAYDRERGKAMFQIFSRPADIA